MRLAKQSQFIPLQSVVYFISFTFFGSKNIHILHKWCATIKMSISRAKGLIKIIKFNNACNNVKIIIFLC
jgi:hypothetical protein